MASFLRQIVASPRTRHAEADLDLCYVTDNIIATYVKIIYIFSYFMFLFHQEKSFSLFWSYLTHPAPLSPSLPHSFIHSPLTPPTTLLTKYRMSLIFSHTRPTDRVPHRPTPSAPTATRWTSSSSSWTASTAMTGPSGSSAPRARGTRTRRCTAACGTTPGRITTRRRSGSCPTSWPV